MRLNASALRPLNISASAAVVDVQWSTDELFKPVNTKTRRNQESPLVVDVTGRLVDAQVFVRVSSPEPKAGACPPRLGSLRRSVWTLSTSWRRQALILSFGNAKTAPMVPTVWDPSSGQTWWPNLDFGACPDCSATVRACLLPSACLGAPNPDLYNAISTGRGRRRPIWRGFTGGMRVASQRRVTRNGASNKNAQQIPLAASAAPVAQVSSAKDWPIAPCAQGRAPIVRCWHLAFLLFCWGNSRGLLVHSRGGCCGRGE